MAFWHQYSSAGCSEAGEVESTQRHIIRWDKTKHKHEHTRKCAHRYQISPCSNYFLAKTFWCLRLNTLLIILWISHNYLSWAASAFCSHFISSSPHHCSFPFPLFPPLYISLTFSLSRVHMQGSFGCQSPIRLPGQFARLPNVSYRCAPQCQEPSLRAKG